MGDFRPTASRVLLSKVLGLNRVRVFEHPRSGVLYLEYRERDPRSERLRRRAASTRHLDRRLAVQQAHEIAARLATSGAHTTGDPTLRTLFDIYDGK